MARPAWRSLAPFREANTSLEIQKLPSRHYRLRIPIRDIIHCAALRTTASEVRPIYFNTHQAGGWKWNADQIEGSAAAKILELAESLLNKMDPFVRITRVEGGFPTWERHCAVLTDAYVRLPAIVSPPVVQIAPTPLGPQCPSTFPTPQTLPMMCLSRMKSEQITEHYSFDHKTMIPFKTILISNEKHPKKSAAILWWFEWHLDTINREGNAGILRNLAGKFAAQVLKEIMKWAITNSTWNEQKLADTVRTIAERKKR